MRKSLKYSIILSAFVMVGGAFAPITTVNADSQVPGITSTSSTGGSLDDMISQLSGSQSSTDSEYLSETTYSAEQVKLIREIAREEGLPVTEYEERVGAKKAAITVAKYIVKHSTQVTNLVGRTLGSNAGVKFGNAMHNYILPPLRGVVRANNATEGQLVSIIRSGLTASGMSQSAASTLARNIVDVISLAI